MSREQLHTAALTLALLAAPLPLLAQHQHGGADARKPAACKEGDPACAKGGMKGGHDMGGMQEKMHGASWKEMDTFHALLAATYHPAADKKDLAPLRAKGGALADAAGAWSASKAPAACASDEVTAAVAAIAKESRALAGQLTDGATDVVLTKAIAAIHDRFETVEHKCGGGHGGMKETKH